MHKETISVHGGTYHDAATRGINTPIFTSSSYEYMDLDPAQIQPPDFLHRLKLIRPAVSLGAWRRSSAPRAKRRIRRCRPKSGKEPGLPTHFCGCRWESSTRTT